MIRSPSKTLVKPPITLMTFELAKYLCKLDYVIADMMNVKLARTTTLADGGDKCDFRYSLK